MKYRLAIKVTPCASRPGIGSWRTGPDGREELEVRVAEVPEGGAANDAALKLIARALGISRSQVAIVLGATARRKCVEIPFDLGETRRRLGCRN